MVLWLEQKFQLSYRLANKLNWSTVTHLCKTEIKFYNPNLPKNDTFLQT